MKRRFLLAAPLLAVLFHAAPHVLAQIATPEIGAAETVTIDAISIWQASGTVIAAGPSAHAFAGEMRGPYLIDAGAGPVLAGTIACVGVLEADDVTGRQAGSARCVLSAADGASAYGRFSCEGWRLVGCVGPFVLEGGEGRLAGVRGEGPIMLRRHETALAVDGAGRVTEAGLGVASWKGFTLWAAPSGR
jgi:hypothetical protein